LPSGITSSRPSRHKRKRRVKARPSGEATGSKTTAGQEASRNWPEFTQLEKARLTTNNHYPDDLDDEDFIKLRTRTGLANRAMNVMKADIFKGSREEPWLRTLHEDGSPHEELDAIHDRVDLRLNLSTLYDFTMTLGCGGLGLGLVESNYEDIEAEPQNVQGLAYLKPLPKTLMRKIHENTDPSREAPGQIDHYDMIMWEDGKEAEKKVPGERVIHATHSVLDDHVEGISIYKPPYNYFLMLEQVDVACGEVPARVGSPLPVLAYSSKVSPDEKKKAKADFSQISLFKQFMHPREDYEFKLLPTNITLDIKPYADHLLRQISASLTGSEWALRGPAQGTQSTADTALRQWYSWVVNQRLNVVLPWVQDLDQRMMYWGVVPPEDGIWYQFNNPMEANKKEEAEIYEMNSRALKTTLESIQLAGTMGLQLNTEGDVWLLEPAEGRAGSNLVVPMGYAHDRPNLVRKKPRPKTLKVEGEAEKWDGKYPQYSALGEKELDQLVDEWDADTEDQEQRLLHEARGALLDWKESAMAEVRPLWPGDDVGIKSPAPLGEAGAGDVLQWLDGWNPGMGRLFQASQLYFTRAYSISSMHTLTALGTYGMTKVKIPTNDPDSWPVGDPQAVKTLNSYSTEFTEGLEQRFKGELREVMKEGLAKGWSYQKTNKALADRVNELGFGDKDKGAPKSVQRYMHTIRSQARHDRMGEAGVELVKLIVTLDGHARETHLENHERTMTMEEALGIESEWGCRCSDVPVLAYEQKQADYYQKMGWEMPVAS